jgi:uncharacterized DUF497 family protein
MPQMSAGMGSPSGRGEDFRRTNVERTDDRNDYGEMRIYAISLVNGIEITVIYTDRDRDERHIISAWRSEPHERRYFWNHLED